MSFQLASAFSADRVAEIYSDTGGVVRAVSRRVVLSSIAVLALAFSSNSGSPEELNVEADEGGIGVTRYAADRVEKRPAVLVLHGNRGVEFSTRAYERDANALASGGIDAYLVRYFTAEDHQALDPKKSARESRDAYTTSRFEGWTDRISSVVAAILERPDSSGRIGLLGFSLGGYIAADAAAHDQRVTAIAVLYGGMPDAHGHPSQTFAAPYRTARRRRSCCSIGEGRRTREARQSGWSTSRASHLSRSGARLRFLRYRSDDRMLSDGWFGSSRPTYWAFGESPIPEMPTIPTIGSISTKLGFQRLTT
jgi:dienelactone hydrolase